jgi:hypothetical protein
MRISKEEVINVEESAPQLTELLVKKALCTIINSMDLHQLEKIADIKFKSDELKKVSLLKVSIEL